MSVSSMYLSTLKTFPHLRHGLIASWHEIVADALRIKPRIPRDARWNNEAGSAQWDDVNFFDRIR